MNVLSIEFFAALFGASFQELLYWNGLKKKLGLKSIQKMYKSVGYWVITIAVILASGVGVLIWVGASAEYVLRDYALMGAAFPALFKMGVSSLSGGSGPKLGDRASSLPGVATMYFNPERGNE